MPETVTSTRKRVTLSQIASYAGVSSTTASFVLSRRQDMRISVRTERRVLDAARTLGYVPRRTTPSIDRAHLPDIGFISDTVATDSFAGDLIRGCTGAAAEQDRLLLTAETDGTPELESFAVERLLARGVGEYVLASTGVWRRPVPNALIGRSLVLLNCVDPNTNVPAVLPDDRAAGRAAAALLLEHGHGDRIHLVGSAVPSRVAGHSRLQGVNEVLRGEGLSLAGITECEWLPADARQAVAYLLQKPVPQRPSAVVALNDRIALGAYQAAAAAGLSIPHDLSVVSFDDSDLAQWLDPGLTSFRIPHLGMGRLAVELLLRPSTPQRHHLPMTLTVRSSVSAPAGTQIPRSRRSPSPREARQSAATSARSRYACALDDLPAVGHPATRALRGAGYRTLLQLAGVPRKELAGLRNVGPKALAHLQAALEHHGLSLG